MPDESLLKLEIVKLGGRFPPVLFDPQNVIPLGGYTTLHFKTPATADTAGEGSPPTEAISLRVLFQANGRKGLRFHVVPYFTDARGKSNPLVIDRLAQDVKNVEAAIAATNGKLEFMEKNKDKFKGRKELFDQNKAALQQQAEQFGKQLEQANRMVTQYNDLKGAAQIHFRVVVDLGEGNRMQLIQGGELVRDKDIHFENLERKQPAAGD